MALRVIPFCMDYARWSDTLFGTVSRRPMPSTFIQPDFPIRLLLHRSSRMQPVWSREVGSL